MIELHFPELREEADKLGEDVGRLEMLAGNPDDAQRIVARVQGPQLGTLLRALRQQAPARAPECAAAKDDSPIATRARTLWEDLPDARRIER